MCSDGAKSIQFHYRHVWHVYVTNDNKIAYEWRTVELRTLFAVFVIKEQYRVYVT